MDNNQEITKNDTAPKKPKKLLMIVSGVILGIIIVIFLIFFIINESDYQKACDLIKEGKYEQAVSAFEQLGGYKDSKDKITESNRRRLYAAIVENNGFTLHDGNYTYDLKPDGDKISFGVFSEEYKFYISFDMTTDNSTFLCEFTLSPALLTTSRGKCSVSALKTDENSLTLDETSGYFDAERMKNLADSSCDLLCMSLDPFFKKANLDFTPADIGFSGID